MVGRTKRELLVDPVSSETFQIHIIPGILLFFDKSLNQTHGSVAKKSVYSESEEIILLKIKVLLPPLLLWRLKNSSR